MGHSGSTGMGHEEDDRSYLMVQHQRAWAPQVSAAAQGAPRAVLDRVHLLRVLILTQGLRWPACNAPELSCLSMSLQSTSDSGCMIGHASREVGSVPVCCIKVEHSPHGAVLALGESPESLPRRVHSQLLRQLPFQLPIRCLLLHPLRLHLRPNVLVSSACQLPPES